MNQPTIQPVILGGGSGTRLWPLSRERHPKQLLPLVSADSLLQATARRLESWRDGPVIAAPIVVCNEEYRFLIADQFRQIDQPPAEIILEPAGRNTAPALALAALRARADGGDPILLAMPADQVVDSPVAFCEALASAVACAADGNIVTFGVQPTRPETGYGYLRLGRRLAGGTGWRLDRFVEKPDAESAAQYVADGRHLWNAGIFMMRASVWLAALERYEPAMAHQCALACEKGQQDDAFFRVDRDSFLATPANSIDYAVMEPLAADPDASARPVVVPLVSGWSDVGAWDALWRVANKDEAGNFVSGDGLLEDVRDSLVISQGRLVACLGLRDTIVVETPDAVFVAAADRAPEVRKVVERLKEAERSEAACHRKQYRPWGWYDALDGGQRFQVKRIVVNPQASLSLQLHHHRAEHWIVVHGTAEVTRGDETFLLGENESTYIPLGVRHRLANPGKLPLEIIEVQSGPYLGEDDIVRFVDDYGRVDEPSMP
jgi:mannose-1-phosphate guanylyltransferase/mannose-6-phosphate isomerase